MKEEHINLLRCVAESLPDGDEKIILFVMLGNIYAGVSNRPFADFAHRVARQILSEIKPQ